MCTTIRSLAASTYSQPIIRDRLMKLRLRKECCPSDVQLLSGQFGVRMPKLCNFETLLLAQRLTNPNKINGVLFFRLSRIKLRWYSSSTVRFGEAEPFLKKTS